MGLLKDQDVLHFKDVLQVFSILHAPKPCRGSVKLFHLMSWSFHTAELCHPCEGQGCPLCSPVELSGPHGGISRGPSQCLLLSLSTRRAWEQGLGRACVDSVKYRFLLLLLPHAQVEQKPIARSFSLCKKSSPTVISHQIPSTPGSTPCTMDSGLLNSPAHLWSVITSV